VTGTFAGLVFPEPVGCGLTSDPVGETEWRNTLPTPWTPLSWRARLPSWCRAFRVADDHRVRRNDHDVVLVLRLHEPCGGVAALDVPDTLRGEARRQPDESWPPRDRPSAWSSGSAAMPPGVVRPGSAGPLFLAPAACWWARQIVESTDTSHSMCPAASALTCNFVKTLPQVPSIGQRRKSVYAVSHGPYRSGMSRHGEARPCPPPDPVEDLPPIPRRPAHLRYRRQQPLQPHPLFVRQITSHPKIVSRPGPSAGAGVPPRPGALRVSRRSAAEGRRSCCRSGRPAHPRRAGVGASPRSRARAPACRCRCDRARPAHPCADRGRTDLRSG